MTEVEFQPLVDHSGIAVRRLFARVVDDGLLLAIAVGIAVAIASAVEPPDPTGEEAMAGISGGVFAEPTTASLVAVLFVAASVAVLGGFSLLDGRSPGRAIFGVQVVRNDGRVPTPGALFGRELVRIAAVALTIALVSPATAALQAALVGLGPDDARTVSLLVTATTLFLPFVVVAAGWFGIAASDDEGRAPHDRLTKTRVVRA